MIKNSWQNLLYPLLISFEDKLKHLSKLEENYLVYLNDT
ncbi:hypothetical protein EV196_10471 [Mariniflexile fucanivorans]|uniref:Uncharacterized protein n=1 Tax=Mariniflexile fucanivorans TaxID=264023 RepID=A0A4R1RIV2_9FLAO|nr:hypothetical protein EV196_10471 [Mariniflexile fucanivorans]